MNPGDTVMYYRNGWRYGEVAEVTAKQITIRPFVPGKHAVRVPVEDVRKVEEK